MLSAQIMSTVAAFLLTRPDLPTSKPKQEGKERSGCGSKIGTPNGTLVNGHMSHGLKPAVPWWFNFDPYPFGEQQMA